MARAIKFSRTGRHGSSAGQAVKVLRLLIQDAMWWFIL